MIDLEDDGMSMDSKEYHHVVWGKPEPSSSDSSITQRSLFKDFRRNSQGLVCSSSESASASASAVNVRPFRQSTGQEQSSASASSMMTGSKSVGRSLDTGDRRSPASLTGGSNDTRSSGFEKQRRGTPSESLANSVIDERGADHEGHFEGDWSENDRHGAERSAWSEGSALHAEGRCRPCHYFGRGPGCLNGEKCEFCHLSHPKSGRPRPCKTKRQHFKSVVSKLEEADHQGPEALEKAIAGVTSRNEYLQRLITRRVKEGRGAGDEAGDDFDDEDGARGGSNQELAPYCSMAGSSADRQRGHRRRRGGKKLVSL